MLLKPGDWAYHAAFDQPCQVIEARSLWGEHTYRVWLCKIDRVVQVAANALQPLAATARLSADAIIYRATGARIGDALANETLLAPLAATVVPLPGLPDGVSGLWSLWRICVSAHEWRRQRFLPIFVHDDGRILAPTARRVWDNLLANHPVMQGEIAGDAAARLVQATSPIAEAQGQPIHRELRQAYQRHLERLVEKKGYAFGIRRRALERIGLYEVRLHRMAMLQQEEVAWQADLEQRNIVTSALEPLLFMRVEERLR